MPWRNTWPMDERRKFIEDWLEDQLSVAALCEVYGISRKTGYKWIERFEALGRAGLVDQRRDSHRHPNATLAPTEFRILELRKAHPFWGPKKLKKRLELLHPNLAWPAASTIGDILRRRGVVMPRRKRRRAPLYSGPYVNGLQPNDVWAADFKGWFRTQDGTRIDPLTITDSASRYLIRCRGVSKTNAEHVQNQFAASFREFGMPKAIRTDNGAPFASRALGGLSALSVWLIKLGITPERTRPAHPQDNGAHERMHRTLKQETAKPPKADPDAQQAAFERFRQVFNDERPHEALGMRTPAQIYTPSPRTFPARPPKVEYPAGVVTKRVTSKGALRFKDREFYAGPALANEYVRLDEEEAGRWAVSYGHILFAELDLERGMNNRPKVLPMRPV